MYCINELKIMNGIFAFRYLNRYLHFATLQSALNHSLIYSNSYNLQCVEEARAKEHLHRTQRRVLLTATCPRPAVRWPNRRLQARRSRGASTCRRPRVCSAPSCTSPNQTPSQVLEHLLLSTIWNVICLLMAKFNGLFNAYSIALVCNTYSYTRTLSLQSIQLL